MKSYTEFVNEKFDYTKQTHHTNSTFFNLKVGDVYYSISGKNNPKNSTIVEHHIKNIKEYPKYFIISCGRKTLHDYVVRKDFIIDNIGVQSYVGCYHYIISSSKKTLEDLIASDSMNMYVDYVLHKKDTDENLFNVIEDFTIF